ncbi:MAG TPA: hypothetical protein VKY32_08995 [Flavobacterium sp.]|nr:hypothetical protein [Flavobacterium sp.]
MLSISMLAVVAVSCQNDDLTELDYSENEQINGTVNRETKVYTQRQVDEKFSTGFFRAEQNGDGKTVFSTSNYKIIGDYIESVEERDLHTLTYLVEYNDDPELFVNLVLYSYDYKEYTPIVFRYDINRSDYKTGMKMPSDKIKAIPIKQGQDYGEVLTNVKSYVPGFTTDDCIDVEYIAQGSDCASGEHSYGEDCAYLGQPGKEATLVSYMLVMDFSDCFDGGGGSGGGGGGGSTGGNPGGNPGGGNPGGGGGGTPDPNPTRPIYPIKTTPIKYIPTGKMNVSLFLFNLQYMGGNADLYQWWQNNAETEEWQEVYDYVYDGGNQTVAKNYIALLIELEENPSFLIEIDCDQLPNWQTLAQHTAPQSVQNKIENLPSSWANDFEIQPIDEANGTTVNLDYFSVDITQLPNNPNTGQQFTADSFLDYMRRNFNDFVDDNLSSFDPYCEIPSMCQTETDLWFSNNPLGSIIYIDIPGDDGVVVCTEYTNSYWYFMTMNAPYAGNHPVSGTRQFGYEQNTNGSYSFFVRGVDRIDSGVMEFLASSQMFGGADDLWTSFQNKTNQFINDNGGNSTVIEPVKNRPNWNKVEEVLNGERPISELGCN